MNRSFLLSFCASLLAIAFAHAEPKSKKQAASPIEAPTQIDRQLFEYQSDDISLVLRTLARQAKINIVIDNRISGTVMMRLEDKTPREAIDIVATAKELIVDKRDGIFYVRPKNPPQDGASETKERSFEAAITEAFTPALAKLFDSALDYLARPETAQKLAKAKKQLYDALIAEGFTKDEAFRIILTNQDISLPNLNK